MSFLEASGVSDCFLMRPVEFIDLIVERPQVVQPSKTQQSAGQHPDDSGHVLLQIQPVDSQITEEGQQ